MRVLDMSSSSINGRGIDLKIDREKKEAAQLDTRQLWRLTHVIQRGRGAVSADSEDGHGDHSQQQREDRGRQEQEPIDSLCHVLPRHGRVVDGRRAQTSVGHHDDVGSADSSAAPAAHWVSIVVIHVEMSDVPCVAEMVLVMAAQSLRRDLV